MRIQHEYNIHRTLFSPFSIYCTLILTIETTCIGKDFKILVLLQPHSFKQNIVAAFQGMHVSPAKQSYVWLPRKCDYRIDRHTNRQTDAGLSDPYVPLCFAGDKKIKSPRIKGVYGMSSDKTKEINYQDFFFKFLTPSKTFSNPTKQEISTIFCTESRCSSWASILAILFVCSALSFSFLSFSSSSLFLRFSRFRFSSFSRVHWSDSEVFRSSQIARDWNIQTVLL